MRYEVPVVVDYGSIAEHTFTHVNPHGKPVHKDHNVCQTDKYGEYSCPSGGSGA
jgi:hypothetical protein